MEFVFEKKCEVGEEFALSFGLKFLKRFFKAAGALNNLFHFARALKLARQAFLPSCVETSKEAVISSSE